MWRSRSWVFIINILLKFLLGLRKNVIQFRKNQKQIIFKIKLRQNLWNCSSDKLWMSERNRGCARLHHMKTLSKLKDFILNSTHKKKTNEKLTEKRTTLFDNYILLDSEKVKSNILVFLKKYHEFFCQTTFCITFLLSYIRIVCLFPLFLIQK